MRTLFFLCLAASAAATESRIQPEQDWLHPQSILQLAPAPPPVAVTRETDAAGGCDGVKSGRWGFHTQNERDPWWQVDLGQTYALERVAIFNRCDSTGARNARILVSLSEDAKAWRKAYQHDGSAFQGFTDQRPLRVPLGGARARYVRLHLSGTSYFHLDEVEVYADEPRANVALGKPATQSSVSPWSIDHGAAPSRPVTFPVAEVVKRGLRLAQDLRARGVPVDREIARLRQPAGAEDRAQYIDARQTVRRLALGNPLLDFDSILFVKGAPTQFPHISDQFYGWWSRPGGGVFLLQEFKSDTPRIRPLTADMPEGNFLRPDLSHDGQRILFAYCRHYPELARLKDKATKANVPEDAFYHVFEMNVDGSGRRQLTRGRYDDFDARYLPSGEIVFLSTRKGNFLQSDRENTAATLGQDLPDSYVRCGGDEHRPVPVFTLHTMDPGGETIRPISAFETFEYTPAIAADGRVLYTRWDYIDRFNGHFFSLWSTNPDGTNAQLVYGNYTVRPQVICEARPIPGSPKLVFTAAAHHSILGGSLALLDRRRGLEDLAPLVRLTPEIPFPETESNVGAYYAGPFPLSEEHLLVGWSNRKLPAHRHLADPDQNPINAMGLYLYDAFGNLTLLYRDPAISSACPIPVRPVPRPTVYAGAEPHPASPEAAFLLQDIGRGLEDLRPGAVRSIRVIGVPPKVQPRMNQPTIGVSREDPGKFVIGTAPVESDGSAHFRVPAGVPVFFQALDADGLAMQTMRSLTYVWPGQTLSCVGCHEHRDGAPPASPRPLAARREPSALRPGPAGSWPLDYLSLVQPVLDRACVSCHRPGEPGARPDLTATRSYDNLLAFADGDLKKLALERDRSIPGDCVARASRLLKLIQSDPRHRELRLDPDSMERLVTWMDTYAQRSGHFSEAQGEELARLRERWQR